MKWIRVTKVDNIPLRQGRVARLGDRDVAIFNLGDGFKALENRCPHGGGPLADGIVSGGEVICPLHNWRVSLGDGSVCKPAGEHRCVVSYPAKVVDGEVLVQLPAGEEKAA